MTETIKCLKGGCVRIVAHKNGKLISMKRGDHHFQMLGNNYSLIATCPDKECATRTSIIMKDGKLNSDDLEVNPLNKISKKKDGEAEKPKGGESKGEGGKS